MDEKSVLPVEPIQPYSKHGDKIWLQCQPILDWLLQNGDEEMRSKALQTRAYWEQEQVWLLQWCRQVKFFQFAESACADLAGFRKAVETLPPETEMQMDYWIDGQEEPKRVDVVVWLALKAGERYKRSVNFKQRGKR